MALDHLRHEPISSYGFRNLVVAVHGKDRRIGESIDLWMGQKYGLVIKPTTTANEIISDPGIDIVVVTTKRPHPAHRYLVDMVGAGKHLVTSNVGGFAESIGQIHQAAYAHDRPRFIGAEATVPGELGANGMLDF